MNCNQCKREVDVNNWKFCPHCGGGLTDEKIILFFRKIFSSKKNLFILFCLEVLLVSSVAYLYLHSRSEQAKNDQKIQQILDKKEEVYVEPIIANDVLPIIYSGDNKKLVEINVSSQVYARLRTEVEIPGITKKDVRIINIQPASRTINLSPDISSEGYLSLADSKTGELNLKVILLKDNGDEKVLTEQKKEIFFYSRNDIVWSGEQGNNFKG